MSRQIPLSNRPDLFLTVDDEDFELLSRFTWNYHQNGKYGKFFVSTATTPSKVLLGKVVPLDLKIDHKDGNVLNCQKDNFRFATQSQNQMNKVKTGRLTASQFKGVSKTGLKKPWQALINLNGVRIFLGRYFSEIEAAQVYNIAAKKLFGYFARLNDVPSPPLVLEAKICKHYVEKRI